jgi:outer membrane autotransporter protein
MNHGKLMAACLVAALGATATARADDSGFYVGASVGEASQSAEGFDGSDTTFGVFGGYSFNPYLAVEGGYLDGGEQTDTQGSLRISVKSDGFFVAGLARLPLGKYVAPYLKVGLVTYDSTATVSSGNVSISESESDSDLLYGLGLEFKLGDHFRLRAEYEQIDVSDADFDIVSLAAAYKF